MLHFGIPFSVQRSLQGNLCNLVFQSPRIVNTMNFTDLEYPIATYSANTAEIWSRGTARLALIYQVVRI